MGHRFSGALAYGDDITLLSPRRSGMAIYYVFPQLVKRVLIYSLIDLLCMLLQHGGMPLI